MTRIVLLGSGSFIARAVARAAGSRNVPYLALPHDGSLDIVSAGDAVINFALTPVYRMAPYDEAADRDLKVARVSAQAGAHFVMLSSRRVYDAQNRWNAHEQQPASGDETAYGCNKARTEKKVQDVLDGKAGIFRLSNIFGYEYDAAAPRRSFLGILLASLKQRNTIFFDMSAATQRDFLPVEICAELLLDRALSHTPGTYNMGSGIPIACGRLAEWVREGYEEGDLICDPDTVRDEFYLNMDKWRAEFPLPLNKKSLRDYCVGLGRRLKCEKY